MKRRLTNRDEVERYILSKMKDDKDAQRMESSEIVLKKFGLLDRDFHLQPFIVSLLTEQIAGYYDSKTKTVNMLDWIAPDEQKPVLAHELTHALQDQHVDLEKWSDQSKESIAKNVDEDNDHLRWTRRIRRAKRWPRGRRWWSSWTGGLRRRGSRWRSCRTLRRNWTT